MNKSKGEFILGAADERFVADEVDRLDGCDYATIVRNYGFSIALAGSVGSGEGRKRNAVALQLAARNEDGELFPVQSVREQFDKSETRDEFLKWIAARLSSRLNQWAAKQL